VTDRQANDTEQPEALESSPQGKSARFSRAGLLVGGIIVAALIWLTLDLLLLVFAGILLAIFLRTLADALAARTPLGPGLSLAVVLLLLVVTTVGAATLFATQLAGQAREITERVPQAYGQLLGWLENQEWSRWLVEQARGAAGQGENGGASAVEQAQVMEHATSAASSAMDAIVAFVIVLFVGIYLAASPGPYIRGVLRLVPIRRRERIGATLYAAGYTLRWWLFGQLLAMTVVGVTMGVGLAIIGVPLALGLGVIAGLFEFIPTLGPMLGLLPALLLALVEDPQKALWVLVLYAVLQSGEAYVLTPLVQQRAVHLPPVLTIAAQVLFAWRLGAVGLIVAVPMVAVIVVAVQMLYVKDVLRDRLDLHAEEEGRRELEEAGHLKSLS
jgi:predicted PurR-regulated permease PerM